MRIIAEPLPDVYIMETFRHHDLRGSLIKPFNINDITSAGLDFNVAEHFVTVSRKDVVRGMHFQAGGSAHDKIVQCLSGRIMDVVVDPRRDSPFYNRPFSIELSTDDGIALFISSGYAHGFATLEDNSHVSYLVTTIHNPVQDSGVLWSSIDYDWPIKCPIISERDLRLPPIC